MHLLFKENRKIRERPDLGCQVSKARSMLAGCQNASAKNAALIEVCESSVFSPESSACAVSSQMEARAQPSTGVTLRGVGATLEQPCRAGTAALTPASLQSWPEGARKLCPAKCRGTQYG